MVRWIAVAMLSLTLGLHWAVLQTAAWTAMLVERVQEMPVWEAITTTFDGQHPCRMCLVVKEGKAGERQQQEVPASQGIKIEVFLDGVADAWLRDEPQGDRVVTVWEQSAASWKEPPGLRPPRWV